ncbi:MAG: L-lactate dehydrogenase complex protein LldE [Kribbellaceae bacterium]|jgi:L-lactate dehydrogenase complex protein LldE|nr:L-lactate dehydrogenase complex protein LldE [Kribbellaceae bacterium]
MKVQLFVTCLVDLAYPEVGERTVALLERLGCEVGFPPAQTCCGQPAFNSGHPKAAKRVAAAFVDAFAETEGPIVAPFGSCVHMVRHGQRRLVDDDPRARRVADRVRDLASFVVDDLGRSDVGGRYPGVAGDVVTPVAWHDECHLLRGLGAAGAARTLLAGVTGCQVVQTARADLCCGFGGTFAVKVAAVSAAMADEKLDRALEAGARAIVSTDPGCLMHLEGRARRRGLDLAVHHLVDLLEPDGRL